MGQLARCILRGLQTRILAFNFDNILEDNIDQTGRVAGAATDFIEDQDLGNADKRYTASNISFEGLTFLVQFLRTKSDTRSLARPRILTLNNETAEIRISTDEAIGITSSVTGADAGTEAVTEAERANTGVVLTVTPQANVETGEIVMAIEPKVIQATPASGFVGADQFKNTEERGSKSILRVTDGDTIIIGGLLRSDESDARTKVPVIGSIPVLGGAFRHKDKSVEERELIIFITPQILDEDYIHQFAATPAVNPVDREQNPMISDQQNRMKRDLSLIESRY